MAVAMAIASWRTCRGHDGMLSPNFYPNPFIEGELQHFQHFSIWRPSAILNFKNFNIWSRDCHWSRNLLLCTKFHKIGSRVRPPDAHNCWMLNAPLLGNGLSHGNRIMAAMSGRRWDSTTQVSSQSVHSWASYGISNMAAVRNFELKKFNIWSRDCHSDSYLLLCTKFHQNWFTRSASRRPLLLNIQCAVARHGPCHGNRITADMSGTGWDAVTQVSSQSLHW